MQNINNLLSEYGESHKNETNKAIHWVCVPLIFFSIVGIFYSIKLPFYINGIQLNVALIFLLTVLFYYTALSFKLAIGMLVFCILCLLLCQFIEANGFAQLWFISILIFIAAWIGQFYGHKIEGKKPSFFKDLQFLMVGPAWLMSFIYKKLGLGL